MLKESFYPPLENMLSKTEGNIYKLVLLAAKRSIELAGIPASESDTKNHSKPVTLALREISESKVVSSTKAK